MTLIQFKSYHRAREIKLPPTDYEKKRLFVNCMPDMVLKSGFYEKIAE